MFKRVEKRQQKKAEAEELGLDEDDTKIFQEQETDSDESDSDSVEDSDNVDEDGETDDDETFTMTLAQVRHNPIVLPMETSNTHTCLVCPGKVFRDPEGKEVTAHLESNSHMRRLKRISEIMSKLGTVPANIPKIVASLNEQKTKNDDSKVLTNRARKRIAKLELLKEKRQTRKEMKNKKIARKKLADETKKAEEESTSESADAPMSTESLVINTTLSKETQTEHKAPKPKKRKRSTNDSNNTSSKESQKEKKRKIDGVVTASIPPNNKLKKKVSFVEPDNKSMHKKGNKPINNVKKDKSILKNKYKKELVRYFDDSAKKESKKGVKGRVSGNEVSGPVLHIFK